MKSIQKDSLELENSIYKAIENFHHTHGLFPSIKITYSTEGNINVRVTDYHHL